MSPLQDVLTVQPSRDLKTGERVHGGHAVGRCDERTQTLCVPLRQRDPCGDGSGRPRGQAAWPRLKTQSRGEHGIVGDEVVQERLDKRLGAAHAPVSAADAAGSR